MNNKNNPIFQNSIKNRIQIFLPMNYNNRNQNKSQSCHKNKSILNDFSCQLNQQLDKIKFVERKTTKNFTLNNQNLPIGLPHIKPLKVIEAYKKRKKMPIKQLVGRANQIQLRMYRIQKNNSDYWQNLKSQSPSSMMQSTAYKLKNIKSHQRENMYRMPMYQPMMYAPFPSMSMPIQSQFPFPFQSPFNSNQNMGRNQNGYQNNGNSNNKGKKNAVFIPEERKQFLKRRIRIIGIAVLFVFVYRTYSKTVMYKKCQAHLQVQQIFNSQYRDLQIDLFKCFQELNIYREFYELSKKMEQDSKSEDQVTVIYEQEEITINIAICRQYLNKLLTKIQQSVKRGQFDIFKPILSNFLDGNFPLSRVFIPQQLAILKLNAQFGYLQIPPQISKILIINYFFIKIFIYNLLGKKQLLTILLKVYKKKPNQKKITLLYGKKLTIVLVLLYETLNSIYFSSVKKTPSNYKSVQQKLKVKTMKGMKYNFSVKFEQQQTQQENHLIKNIKCPQSIVQLFIFSFQDNWKKIKSIGQILYKDAVQFKQKLFQKNVKEVKQQPFPQRKKLKQFLDLRAEKLHKKYDDQQDKSSSDDQQTDLKKKNKNKKK